MTPPRTRSPPQIQDATTTFASDASMPSSPSALTASVKFSPRVRVYEVPRVEDHDRASLWWTRDEFAAALEQAAAHYAKTRNMRNHSLSKVDRTISLAPFVATLIAIILLQRYT